ncbi:Hypothetical protein PBC10988_21200 [Planctomycetales bacterium 10988]|nr:Hypothetical protein PBC10988_21200 [Planctomycetales bacterium 10988]
MPKDYLSSWKNAKKKFTSVTNIQKKPKEHSGFRSKFEKSGLVPAIKEVMKKEIPENQNITEDDLAPWKAAIKGFTKQSDKYFQVLDREIKSNKAIENGDKKIYYRGLKILITELNAIKAEMQNAHSEGVIRIQSVLQEHQVVLRRVKKVVASLKRARAVVSKIKGDPTMDTFKELIPEIVAQVRIQIIDVNDYLKSHPDAADAQFIRTTSTLVNSWDPWRKQRVRDVGMDSEVPPAIKEFSTLIKQTEQWTKLIDM